MSRLNKIRALDEAFESKRFEKGKVPFSSHTKEDEHIKEGIKLIAKQLNIPESEVHKQIDKKLADFAPMRDKAPILYSTIANNILEDSVFTLMKDSEVEVEGAPKFKKIIFYKLVDRIKAEHGEFFPMRSFLNHKRLHQPSIYFTPDPSASEKIQKKWAAVSTAGASPKGDFIFNIPFMQKLMDFAHMKKLKPKGKKYVSNGGEIPDEYAYIEFVIMHEFMHYTHDDFHYQKVIPKANPTIINWVGDFRTNYLLVKSGFSQLPMGLFNDDINYDRQHSYIEMYNIVKSEFEKLNDKEKDDVEKQMKRMSDEHEPGQNEGKEMQEGEDMEEGEGKEAIDKKFKQTEKQMEDAKDMDDAEAKDAKAGENQKATEKSGAGGRGSRDMGDHGIDYDKIKPKFNWKTLIKLFVASMGNDTEETYQKPSRRSISGMHTAAQTGSGAMKPGDMPVDLKTAKLAFCVDSSGSMGHIIEKVYSNINLLLKANVALQNAMFTLIKYSGGFEVFKGIFKGDKAGKVDSVSDKPAKMDLKMNDVFNKHLGGGTNFDAALSHQLQLLIKDKNNVIILSDSDILSGDNFTELMKVINTPGGKVFIIFEDRDCYIKFRQQAKMSSPYFTYFED